MKLLVFVIAALLKASLIDAVNLDSHHQTAGFSGEKKERLEQISVFRLKCFKKGFKFEKFDVTTEDGYILTLFRIPGLLNEEPSEEAKPPVLFQHGINLSAVSWIHHSPEVAPAFVAARAGYDVWLTNHRGNLFSQEHTTLVPGKDDKKYWNFSFQEMADYDLPAIIELI